MYFFFFLFAILGVASALMVITRKNVMHAALFLLLTFACVGGMYVLLRAEMLAAAQVLIYAGAVTILFIIASFLINIPRSLRLRQWYRQTSIAIVILGLTGLWMIIATTKSFGKLELPVGIMEQSLGSPRAIGQALFAEYVLPFEIASLVLLAAMVGALFLARETALEEEQAAEASTTPETLRGAPHDQQLV